MDRCEWARYDADMVAYHDHEWGTPLHDDRGLFEFLILEGAQAGLSWSTILHKRAAYRQAFGGFDPLVVAAYGPEDEARLLADAGIVRNRLKISAAVANARAVLAVQDDWEPRPLFLAVRGRLPSSERLGDADPDPDTESRVG